MRVGYFLSCEEYSPDELVEQAVLAGEAGFTALGISDHFHPWNDAQGHSPFVWSVIGAIGAGSVAARHDRGDLPDGAGAPRDRGPGRRHLRGHARAGRFPWGWAPGRPSTSTSWGSVGRRSTSGWRCSRRPSGSSASCGRGRSSATADPHYTVENARIYTLPDVTPPVLVSAFGPKALEVAIRIGDGLVSTTPDADSVAAFRDAKGDAAPTVGVLKVAYAPTHEEGVHHAHRLWATAGLPGELAQILPTPQHFEQAATLVGVEDTRASVVAGRDPRQHLRAAERYQEAGFSELYVADIGPHWRQMIAFYGDEVLPEIESWT